MTKAEALAHMQKVWSDHEKARPIHNGKGVALSLDRFPMTLVHAEFDEVMDHLDPRGDDPRWANVRELRGQSPGTISREYPGIEVRLIREALEQGGKVKPAPTTKEG